MPRAPDFYKHLDRVELDKFEAFSREPSRTIEQCVEYLQAMGIVVSKSAVGRWKKAFDETDRLSAAAEIADAIHTAASENGTVDVAGAVNLQLAQRLQSVLCKGGDGLVVGDLLKIAMASSALTGSEKRNREMLREIKSKGKQEMDRLKQEVLTGSISPERVEAASKAMFG
jgi:hypothetical protein